ncbi:MAG TPA: RES domain-containing protein, partial [Casimicrobiaceae bacterium]
RGREAKHLELVDRSSYAFTQALGSYLYEQDQNGLLVRSARCEGVNAAIFKASRLSEPRHRAWLTYRLNASRDRFVAERPRGKRWIDIRPSALG